LPPAPAKVYDSLPGDPVGPVLPPKQAGDDGSGTTGKGESLIEKIGDKLGGGPA